MNEIVIKLCDEDRARLDELIGIAGLLTGELKSRPTFGLDLAQAPDFTGPRMTQASDGTVMLVKPDSHPADAPTTHLEPVDAPAPAPDAPPWEVKPVSLGEFQKAIVTRCAESAAVKAKVQALVHKYAPSVSEIPEAKRPEVLAELANL